MKSRLRTRPRDGRGTNGARASTVSRRGIHPRFSFPRPVARASPEKVAKSGGKTGKKKDAAEWKKSKSTKDEKREQARRAGRSRVIRQVTSWYVSTDYEVYPFTGWVLPEEAMREVSFVHKRGRRGRVTVARAFRGRTEKRAERVFTVPSGRARVRRRVSAIQRRAENLMKISDNEYAGPRAFHRVAPPRTRKPDFTSRPRLLMQIHQFAR